MSKELALAVETQDQLITITNLAQTFVGSGLFQDTREVNQAVVKIIAGRELGLPPFTAMRDLFIIKGKVTMAAGQIAAKIKGSGKYDYKVVKLDDGACVLKFFSGEDEIGESSFTMLDAEKAGLTEKEGFMYKKYPRNLLFARALTNGARFYTPDVFNGSIYTPEELEGQERKEKEDVIEVKAEIVEEAPKTPAKAKKAKAKAEPSATEETPASDEIKAEAPAGLEPTGGENDVETLSWNYPLSKGRNAGESVGSTTYNHLKNYLANHGKDLPNEEKLAISVVMERKKRLFLEAKKAEEEKAKAPVAVKEVQKVFPEARTIDVKNPEKLTYEELKTIKLLGGKHEGTAFEAVESDYLRAHLERNYEAIKSKFPWYAVAIERFLTLREEEAVAKAKELEEDNIPDFDNE